MATARKLRWIAALGGVGLLALVAFAALRLGGSVRVAPRDEAAPPGSVSFSVRTSPDFEEELAALAEVAEDTPEGQLALAARNGDADRARELLAEGVSANAEESANGHRPLHQAAGAGHAAILDLLLDAGADLEARDGTDRTALMRAAEAAAVDAGRRLLEAGAEVNAQSETDGMTALLQVVSGSFIRRARSGMTGAVAATHDREMEFARMLFERGADPNLVSEEVPPLKGLAISGNAEMLSLFVDNGARAEGDLELSMLSRMDGPIGDALRRAMSGAAPAAPPEPEHP